MTDRVEQEIAAYVAGARKVHRFFARGLVAAAVIGGGWFLIANHPDWAAGIALALLITVFIVGWLRHETRPVSVDD